MSTVNSVREYKKAPLPKWRGCLLGLNTDYFTVFMYLIISTTLFE